MKAIITQYKQQTGSRGARILAKDSDGNRKSVSYPHELSGEKVYRHAAASLCEKMGWTGALASGGIGKSDQVFVFVDGLAKALTNAKKELERFHSLYHTNCNSKSDCSTAAVITEIDEALSEVEI